MRRRRMWQRAAFGFAAVLAAAGLVALGPVHSANAGTSVDAITGTGDVPSKLTVKWSDGLLGSNNHDIVGKRPDASSPLGFMRSDFENFTVTVSQTQDLVRQGIVVSWTGMTSWPGGTKDGVGFRGNYLQIMECYGDANTGPDPENCEFGSPSSNVHNIGATTRSGNLCASSTPSVDNPPPLVGSTVPVLGCDPAEPRVDPTRPNLPSHVAKNGAGTGYQVPFVPADDPAHPNYQLPPSQNFDQTNSNEVDGAATAPDGTGVVTFQVYTAVESPGLGCGEIETNGQTRNCWLVIVPRGSYEPNGWKLSPNNDLTGTINESPLGATSWAQRIQVHLGFVPIRPACALGSADERPTLGTELATRAVSSWQFTMNEQSRCRVIYGFSSTSEAAVTSQISSSSGAGLAFTTIPIGSEVIRDGNTPGPEPPIAYAPVAVTAIALGFHVDLKFGYVSTPVKLTPRLLAKALTESYKQDLAGSPFPDPNNPIPDWAKNNPLTLDQDPEFDALNPAIASNDPQNRNVRAGGAPEAPLVTVDKSGVNQQVWAWIQADPVARAWLRGQPDDHGMLVNPYFQGLNLDQPPPIESYPRNSNDCADVGAPIPHKRCADQLWPYSTSFNDAASHVGAGINPEGTIWDPNLIAPDGSTGWWGQGSLEGPGQTMMWSVGSTSDMANYSLVSAALCAADGTHCVAPSDASVSNAVAGAKPDSAGLLHVDPAAPGTNAYPLVDVVYAAVRVVQDPAALSDYASLIGFAVNQGQNSGVSPGQLPYGYLPLPPNLRTAGNLIAKLLSDRARKLLNTPPGGSDNGNPGAGGFNPNNNLGGSHTLPNPGAVPAPAASPSTNHFTTTRASAVPASKNTNSTPLGAVRWALFVIVIVGISGSVGGPLLRFVLSRSMP